MKKRITLIGLSLFALLAGCSKQNLSDKKENFSDKGISYSFRLPKNWTTQEQFKHLYNEAAVFGAQDEKSKSDMFIRTTEKRESDVDKFKEKTKKELLKTYDLKEVYVENFEANGCPVIAYTFNGRFDKQTVFVHNFYVLTKQRVVEFTFYSAANGAYEKRAEIFEESVKTLVEEEEVAATETSSEEQSNQKIENTQFSFAFSGYKVLTNSTGSRLLIVRYVFTNKEKEAIAPDVWNSLVTAEQDGKELKLGSVSEEESSSDLSYLLQVAKLPIKKGESVESAAIYELNDSSMSNISMSFDSKEFKDQKPFVISIENK